MIAEKVKMYYMDLLEPSTVRKDKMPDDYLRGQIAALKWLIEWPEKELEEAQINEQQEQEMLDNSARYMHIAKYGYGLGNDSQVEGE
jgi:hypothetical protein